MSIDLWKQLLDDSCSDLRARAASCAPHDAAALTALRRDWPADLVRVAIELSMARRKGEQKFPGRADLVADVPGVEQASSALVANHKAKRFAAAEVGTVTDLCCGIGGDAMSLARIAEVIGVDRDQSRAFMCARNAICETMVGDAEDFECSGAFHLDPARRIEGAAARRVFRLEDYQPGRAFIESMVAGGRDGALKLGPGVDLDALPGEQATEIEFISEHGSLVQAVLWSGRLARSPGQRTTTILPAGASLTASPSAPEASIDGPLRFLVEPEPAVERAGLLGTLAVDLKGVELAPGLGILTTDTARPSPFGRWFEVLEAMPFRPKRLGAAVRAAGAGVVEVKTRDKAVEPNALQSQLSGDGEELLTVFVLRLGRSKQAFLTRRIDVDGLA